MIEYEIQGWPGYYLYINGNEIKVFTSWGFCKGLPRWQPSRPIQIIPGKRRELTQLKNKNGYIQLNLGGKKNKKTVRLHRLIAETLIPNPDNLDCVDHIDGNKLNNHPSNLQWITRGDNIVKAQKMGRWGTPPKFYKIKYNTGDEIIIHNISEFSRNNDYSATKLVAISKGKRNSHKNIIQVVDLTT